MTDRLTQMADEILDTFADQPGTMHVVEIGGSGTGLTDAEADRFVEIVKSRAMERAITINAWFQQDPGGDTVTVQHLAEG